MLTVLCGIPGCGKTTWRLVQADSADSSAPRPVVVCLDEIRLELTGDESCQEANDHVVELAAQRVSQALREGAHVIVDATNITEGHRRRWLRIADELDAPVRCVYIPIAIKAALARNSGRARQVPEHALRRMARELREPSTREGFDDVIRVSQEELARFVREKPPGSQE